MSPVNKDRQPLSRARIFRVTWELVASFSTFSFLYSAILLPSDPVAAADKAEEIRAPSANESKAAIAQLITAATTTAAQEEAQGVPASLIQLLSNSKYYSPYAFVVDKKARTLSVWLQTNSGLKKVASFPADLGKNSGDKRNQGDHKTPEGIYFLERRLEGTSLDFKLYGKRAFTTDYPNYFDRAEGKTGSGIWLHAVPDHVPLTRGSSGCVVVRNDVILDLTQYIKLGRTPILIQNELNLVPQNAVEKENSEFATWLESWRSAWENKNIKAYIDHYSDEFQSMKMDRTQWRDYKARLNEQYKQFTVKISRPALFADRDRAVARFLQAYTSDLHSDFGEKVLYLKKGPGGYKIVGETWGEEASQVAREEIDSFPATAPATDTKGANLSGSPKSENLKNSSGI